MSTKRINDPAYLKGYWPLNSHVDDMSGNGNNGTGTAVVYNQGIFGRSVADFSTSAKVELPSTLSYSSWTYSVWINSDVATDGHLFTDGSATGFTRILFTPDSQTMFLTDSTNTSVATCAVYSPLNAKWSHVAITYDGSNVSWYQNGALLEVDTGVTGKTFNFNRIAGKRGSFTSATEFDGKMSNVRFYNIALTGDEILAIYNQEQNPPKQVVARQPYDALPDIFDPYLTESHLNSATRGNFLADYSNNQTPGLAVAGNDVVHQSTAGAYFSATANSSLRASNTAVSDAAGTIALTTRFDDIVLNNNYAYSQVATGTNRYYQGYSTTLITASRGNPASTVILTSSNKNGMWHRIVVTWNASGVIKAYLDGVYVGQNTYAPVGTADGANFMSPSANPFKGVIKDFDFYSEEKSASWVAEDCKKRIPDTSLKFWTKCGCVDLSMDNNTIAQSGGAIVGKNMYFDGTDDYVQVTTTNTTVSGAFTASMWIMNPGTPSGNNRFFEYSPTGSAGPQLYVTAGNGVVADNAGGLVGSISAANAFVAGQWAHVALVRGSANAYLYVNGALVGTTTVSSPSANTKLTLGAQRSLATYANVYMDDVRIYNEEKSAGFIKDIYQQTRKYY